jgi:anti-anti-sigma regulatory factor
MAVRKKKSSTAPGDNSPSRSRSNKLRSKKHESESTHIDRQSNPIFSEKSIPVTTGRENVSQDSATIFLDPVITLAEVSQLKESLIGYIGAHQIKVDVSKVEQIDTAGLQLLLAFSKTIKKQGGKITWLGESTAYSRTADLLNLTAALGPGDK